MNKHLSMVSIVYYSMFIHIIKSSLYIYIKYIEFGLVWFYGISTIVGYLLLNPLSVTGEYA